MPRLIDDLRAGGRVTMPHWVPPSKVDVFDEHAALVMAMLTEQRFPVILMDNVADYYFTGTGQENWDLTRDFPNFAPPYDVFWMEHRMPKVIHSDSEGDTSLSEWIPRGGRVGAFFAAVPPDQVKGYGIPPCRWIVWAELFIDYGQLGRPPDGPHGSIFLAIDEDGRLVNVPHMQTFCHERDSDNVRPLISWLYPMFLTISFLHCKNVVVEDQTVPKPLAKRYKERHGVWPTDYKTLVIEPLKQILRKEGGSAEHGIARALHICRGHFRDYRQGRGLFGKYHQLVWTPMTVRGTKGAAPPAEREVKVKLG